MSGVVEGMRALGSFVGPFMGGWLFQCAGFFLPFTIIGTVMGCAAGIILYVRLVYGDESMYVADEEEVSLSKLFCTVRWDGKGLGGRGGVRPAALLVLPISHSVGLEVRARTEQMQLARMIIVKMMQPRERSSR